MNGFENAFDQQDSFNAAEHSRVTSLASDMWAHVARPLAEEVFTPLAEQNRGLAVTALNGTLTAPRLLKPLIGRRYDRHVENGQRWRAVGDVVTGIAFDVSDGLDGAVARESGLQTEFGTGFDPFVDAVSLGDDSRRVRKQAEKESDHLVLRMLGVESKIKLAGIALGGPGAKLTAMAAERNGAKLEPEEQPHAVPMGKVFFAASAAGKKALQLGYAFPEGSKARTAWRATGVGLTGIGIGFGAGSVIQYAGANIKRLRKAFSKH